MAGDEEILFNVNGNASNAVSALNEWISAIQNVQKSFGELATSIGDLNSAFSGLTQSIDGVMTALEELAASPAAEMLGTLVEAASTLEETGGALAEALTGDSEALTELADTATAASDAFFSSALSADQLDTALSAMGVGLNDVSAELDNVGPAGDAAQQALQNFANAIGESVGYLTEFPGETDAVSVALEALNPAFNAAKSAMDGLSQSAPDAYNAFLSLSNSVDVMMSSMISASSGMNVAGDASKVAADNINSASQIIATSADSIKASGDQIASTGGDVEALNVALTSVPGSADAVTPVLLGLAQQASNVQTAFQQAAQGATDFESIIDSLITAIDGLTVAVEDLSAAEETNTVAEDTDKQGMGNEAMQLMMLIPMITQTAGGFLQMGMAAEDAISHITGLADQTLALSSNSNTLNADINALEVSSQKYGVSMSDAANGLYYIISAGFSTADALKVLDVSMEASAATGTKMQDVSNALTSVMHAYNLSASQAKVTQDQLTEAVVGGKQDYTTFANAIGKTAAAASSAHLSLKEMLAAEATLTQINPSVRQDTANLGNLMQVLGVGMDKTAKTAKSLGLSFDESSYKTMDLYEKIQYLNKITGGNSTQMRALLQNATAYGVAMNLMRDNGTLFTAQMINQGNAVGSTDRAFQQASQTISFALNQISAALSVMSYNFVRAIGPVVAPMFEKFAALLGNLASNTQILMPVIGGLAAALGVLLVAAVAAVTASFWGMLAPFGAIAIAIGAVAAIIIALIPRFQALYNSAGPVGTMLRDMVATAQSTAMTLRDALGGAIAALHPLFLGLGNILHNVVMPALGYLAGGIGYSVAQIFNAISSAVRAATPYIQQFGVYIEQHVAPALQRALPAIEQYAGMIGRLIPILIAVGGPLLALRGAVGMVSSSIGLLEPVIGGASAAFNAFKGPAQVIWDVMRALGGAIRAPFSAFAQLQMTLQTVGETIMGSFRFALLWLRGAFIPIIDIIEGAGGPFQAFLALCQAGGAAIGQFAGALIAMINPVTVIAAVLIALTAILVHWLVTTQQGHQVLAALWAALVQVGQVILSSLAPAWKSLQASMALIWTSIQQVWVALQPLMPVFLLLAKIIGGIVVAAIFIAIAAIVGIITALANFVAGLVNVIAHVIQFASGVIQVFAGLFTMLKGLLHGNWSEISQGWQTFLNGLKNMWEGLWGAIVGIAKTFINTIKGLVGGFASTITGIFHSMADAVVHHSIWPDMWTAVSANTQQNTAKVHAQVQTFSSNTQATFLQLQTASVAHMAQMWRGVQVSISASMNASASAVRLGLTAITVQINAFDNTTSASVTRTWTLMAKTLTTTMTVMLAEVRTGFTSMQTTATKDLNQMVKDNTVAWDSIGKSAQINTALMVTTVDKAYQDLAKVVATDTATIIKDDTDMWAKIWQDARVYLQQIQQVYVQFWTQLTTLYKQFNTQWYTLDVQQWLLERTLLITNQTAFTLLWTTWWKALILLFTTQWTALILLCTNSLKLMTTAFTTGSLQIEAVITKLIQWITQQFTALAASAQQWGLHFAQNFAAGINAGAPAIQSAVAGMSGMMKSNLGHTKPSTGVLSDDDVWGLHFVQNFAKGIEQGIPILHQAAQNAASIIAATMPTAQNVANATTNNQGNVTNGAEHLQVLKQILAQLKTMQQGGNGSVNNYGSTQIGYNIPSTQLGSIIQQFSNGNNQLSASQIANIYNQINQLQGLSQEYAARGASTGVGF